MYIDMHKDNLAVGWEAYMQINRYIYIYSLAMPTETSLSLRMVPLSSPIGSHSAPGRGTWPQTRI